MAFKFIVLCVKWKYFYSSLHLPRRPTNISCTYIKFLFWHTQKIICAVSCLRGWRNKGKKTNKYSNFVECFQMTFPPHTIFNLWFPFLGRNRHTNTMKNRLLLQLLSWLHIEVDDKIRRHKRKVFFVLLLCM